MRLIPRYIGYLWNIQFFFYKFGQCVSEMSIYDGYWRNIYKDFLGDNSTNLVDFFNLLSFLRECNRPIKNWKICKTVLDIPEVSNTSTLKRIKRHKWSPELDGELKKWKASSRLVFGPELSIQAKKGPQESRATVPINGPISDWKFEIKMKFEIHCRSLNNLKNSSDSVPRWGFYSVHTYVMPLFNWKCTW